MRFLFTVLIFVPMTCLGLGAESIEYIGFFADGSKISMRLASEGRFTKWTGTEEVYGSTSNLNLRYCWSKETSIKEDNSYSQNIDTHFVCARKIGEPPVVFFRKGQKSGNAYQKAMDTFKSANYCEGEFGGYYSCEKGCNDSTPTLVFRVEHWEQACGPE